jgi:transposase-like protein
MPEALEGEIADALAGGLGNLSLRELLGMTLSNLGHAERKAYLARATADKGNGTHERSLMVGSIPVELKVARTRSGAFRPSVLPRPYERGYPEGKPRPCSWAC